MAFILLIISSLTAIILSLFAGKNRKAIEGLAIASSFIELALGTYIAIYVSYLKSYSLSNLFKLGALEALLLLITVIIGFVSTLYSVGYLRRKLKQGIIGFKRFRQYYVLLRLFLISMFAAIAANNPMIMWIAIEATTLSTVFLISFYNRPFDIEASWKYLIINTVGILFGLLGTLLFLTSGSSINELISWHDLLRASLNTDPLILKFAFILIFIGYGTKMGIVPMHSWKPDTYNRAPSPIVALLSGAFLNIALLAILRFKMITDPMAGTFFTQNLFIFFGTLSIAFAAFIIFTQTNYKRLLAYSSIEHAGIIMLGFGFAGIGIYAAILHMMYHAFAKSLLFLISGNIFFKYNSDQIRNVKGMLKIAPVSAILLILGFLAITGIPPFGTFLTELYIALAGFKNYPIAVVIFIIMLILVFIGFFRSVLSMTYDEPPKGIEKEKENLWTILPLIFVIALIIALSLYLPDFLQTLIKNASSFVAKPI